jgi:hypothetical protein
MSEDELYEALMKIKDPKVWDMILEESKKAGCHFMFKMWWFDWDYRRRHPESKKVHLPIARIERTVDIKRDPCDCTPETCCCRRTK